MCAQFGRCWCCCGSCWLLLLLLLELQRAVPRTRPRRARAPAAGGPPHQTSSPAGGDSRFPPPATFSRTLDLFSATWELARSSAKKIGSWCQSQEKDRTVRGSFHQQVHKNQTVDAFIVHLSNQRSLSFKSLKGHKMDVFSLQMIM